MAIKCGVCDSELIKIGINQKYCGKQSDKSSCSYKAALIRISYYGKKYYITNKSAIITRNVKNNKYKYHNDILYRLKKTIRERIKDAVKRRSESSFEYLGCSIDFYKEYLSSLFSKGMNWGNYGKWQIDHIKPISLFDLAIEENIKLAFHYTNTQPMWATLNHKKYNKYGE